MILAMFLSYLGLYPGVSGLFLSKEPMVADPDLLVNNYSNNTAFWKGDDGLLQVRPD